MLALGFTCHSLIVAIIIHPLRHVAAAGRVMGLWEAAVETRYPGALGTGCLITKSILKEDLITALRVGAPCQVGTTFHIASEKGFFILGYNLLGGNNGTDECCGRLCTALRNGTGAAEDHVLFNASCEIFIPTRLAAVVHATEGGWLLSGTQLVHTDWAVGSWAWRALGIFHQEPRGDEQRFMVLYVTLNQEIHIPPAVHEEVPSNILWDAQGILDLLYCLVHEQLCFLQTERVPHWHLQHCQQKLF